MANRTCVSGVGCICKAGKNVKECMQTLYRGGVTPQAPVRFSCEHNVQYPVFEVAAVPSGMTDTDSISIRFLLPAVYEALTQARISMQELREMRVGICVGTTTGASLNFADDYYSQKTDGWMHVGQVRSWLSSSPATTLSHHLELSGPCQTIVNACSSGADAVGVGMSWLQNDVCDVVLACGVDELSTISYNGFIRLGVYSSSPCAPFDANREGLNLGEGAAVLVLEQRDALQARGGRVLARCAGYGTAADAHHLTAPAPDGAGLKQAISVALKQAEISAEDIDFINAHGTATQNNDAVEALVLSSLFPDSPIVATKGYTGHTLGAAGAIEAVFTIMALQDQTLPASTGFASTDPALGVAPTKHVTKCSIEYGLTESLAFGGNNSVLVFAKENTDA